MQQFILLLKLPEFRWELETDSTQSEALFKSSPLLLAVGANESVWKLKAVGDPFAAIKDGSVDIGTEIYF